ncbi:MAG: YdcF family protein [Clostridium sp.]|nr:YdcF family protein [Clostridium sp.]MCM1546883.1 YdcF family protein [Ruminococcus sp.]
MHVKPILLAIEIIIILIFLIPVFSNIINPGNIAGILLGIILLLLTVFNKRIFNFISELWKKSGGKIFLILSAVIACAALIYVLTLSALMISAASDKPDSPDAVVVLGCKVNGDRPSRMLRHRLDAAAEYLNDNQDVICVVSGGKGSDEIISEAEAMKKYLTEKGIDPKRIIEENRSANTYENLENSLAAADLGSGHEIAVVTDGFHQYRAGYIAKNFGVSTSAINAKTDMRTFMLTPTYYLRELMAITNEYLKQYRTKTS